MELALLLLLVGVLALAFAGSVSTQVLPRDLVRKTLHGLISIVSRDFAPVVARAGPY